jgi:hypothetical protein
VSWFIYKDFREKEGRKLELKRKWEIKLSYWDTHKNIQMIKRPKPIVTKFKKIKIKNFTCFPEWLTTDSSIYHLSIYLSLYLIYHLSILCHLSSPSEFESFQPADGSIVWALTLKWSLSFPAQGWGFGNLNSLQRRLLSLQHASFTLLTELAVSSTKKKSVCIMLQWRSVPMLEALNSISVHSTAVFLNCSY